MSANPTVHGRTQRRTRRSIAMLAVVLALVFLPIFVMGDLRLDLAYRFDLAPGKDVVHVADVDDGMTLIVIPFKTDADRARDPYRNRAQFLAKATSEGMDLQDLSTGRTVSISLHALDFIAASDDGNTVLLREGTLPGVSKSVVVDVSGDHVTELPKGRTTPDVAGDWVTPVWEKTVGRCGPRSVTGAYIGCFPSPKFATYLAGDWQLNLQEYGDYRIHAEIFRGSGFRPTIGWTSDDTQIYMQNERGIWRADVGVNPLGT